MSKLFQITVHTKNNCTWQGELVAEERKVPFQSELELLQSISALLDCPILPGVPEKEGEPDGFRPNERGN